MVVEGGVVGVIGCVGVSALMVVVVVVEGVWVVRWVSVAKCVCVFVCLFMCVCDASSIGACRPRIFFINGFLCSLEDEWQWNGEGKEREDATSRRR